MAAKTPRMVKYYSGRPSQKSVPVIPSKLLPKFSEWTYPHRIEAFDISIRVKLRW